MCIRDRVKDNQVYIYPEGKTIKDAKYLLEAPSMEDAAGEISFPVSYTHLDVYKRQEQP